MEGYNNQMDENTSSRGGSFLYGSPSNYGRRLTTSGNNNTNHQQRRIQDSVFINNNNNNNNNQGQISNFHLLQSNDHCYQGGGGQQHQQEEEGIHHPIIKKEIGASSQQHGHKFHYPSIITTLQSFQDHHHQHQEVSGNCCEIEDIKAKIISHPQYTYVLDAYMDCQKVGAPPEVVAKLTAIRKEFEAKQRASVAGRDTPKDAELDQFMESYYDMLIKYRNELTRTLQEAMDFTRKVEAQLSSLSIGPVKIFNPDEKCEGGSSEEEQENSGGGETELPEFNPRAEDRELKNHLLKKYSGYLSSLKQELSKKKKKGKLPKEARQKLLSWWELHYKWPYPSESEKVALAEATGLDQKQINNWFINQRKRHWKPSEDMQFMGMDSIHSQNAAVYLEGHYMGGTDGPYRLCP